MSDDITVPPSVTPRHELSVDEYLSGLASGDRALLARALTLVESRLPPQRRLAEELLSSLPSRLRPAIRVGITGAPGAGKSTFIESLGMLLVRRGLRVAVLAVDPSSVVSGGSVLGDKTRMHRLAAEPAAFIRPSPAAGTLGGVAERTRECLVICEAAGFDAVLIETVGVGQSESIVAGMTDCLVALMIPGAGDELQAIKRGLLEHADVIAVNKADGSTKYAAQLAARHLLAALHSFGDRESAPMILTCSALLNDGLDEVWNAVEARFQKLVAGGQLEARRRRQSVRLLWSIVDERLRQAVRAAPQVRAVCDTLEAAVLSGKLTPEAAAQRILDAFQAP